VADKIADQCAEVVGSSTGELFYRCTTEFADYTHWAGPFFSALFLGILAGMLVGVIAGVR
jgi:hypothetical protein